MPSVSPHPSLRIRGNRIVTLLSLILCLSPVTPAEEPNEKAGKYLQALQRRPSGGYLFDRFFNAWLDTGTVAGLEAYLDDRGGAENADTANRLLLAYFHARQGQDDRAAEIFEKALEGDPDNGEAWLEKAKIELRRLDLKQALLDLERAEASDPKPDIAIEIGKRKGRLLARQGKPEQALEVWKKLARKHPEDELLQEDLVDLQLSEGLLDEAVTSMRELVAASDDAYLGITRRLRLGDILQRAGQREKALAEYGACLADSGRGSWLEREIVAQIEQVFRREDDINGLRDHLADLEKTEKGRITLMKRRAAVLAELNETEEAIATFEEILKLTPGDRANREAFIALLARLKQFEEAAEQAGTLADLHPGDIELIAQLALRQDAAGRTDEAVATVLDYLEKSDGSEYAHLRAARMLEQFGNNGEAGKIYDRLVASFPESTASRETQAGFLFRTGREDEAVAIWKDIGTKGTGDDALRAAQALLRRGKPGETFAILQARSEEFENDFRFLGLLADTALRIEKFEEALPVVERRLDLAADASGLNEAIRQVLTVLDRLEKSGERLASLQEKSPNDRSLTETCLLAELLEREQRFDEAETALAPLIVRREPLAMAQQVRLFRSRNEWAKAAGVQLQILNSPGGRKSENVRDLVTYFRRALDFTSALTWIEEWKKVSPGATQPWMEHSAILVEDGKIEEAIRAIRSAVQRFDGDSGLRSHLAILYRRENKLADAERIYWTLYEESEDAAEKIRWAGELAGVASADGRLEKLISQFEERRRGNRTSAIPLLALAEIYRRDDDYEKRREMLLEVTRMRPEDVNLLKEIARIEEESGNWEQARETLQLAVSLDRTAASRRRLAELELRYGDEESAYRQIEELAGGPDMDADTVLGVADTMVLRSGWERAEEFLDRHAGRFPEDYRVTYLLAVAHGESGRTARATDLFLQLLEWEHEVAAKPSSSRVQIFVGQFDKEKDWLPEGSGELLDWMSHIYRVFQYRQNLRRGISGFSRFSGRMTGGVIVPLPGSVEAAREWAKTNLLGLAQAMTREETTALAGEMSRHGVKSADILLNLPFSENYRQLTIPEELLEEFPDRRLPLTGLIVLTQQNLLSNARGGAAPIDVALMKRCYDTLSEAGYVDLALAAAAYAASSGDEDGITFLRRARRETRGKLREKPIGVLTYVFGQLCGGTSPFQSRVEFLPEDLRIELIDQIAEWREVSLKDEEIRKNYQSFSSFQAWGSEGTYLMHLENYDRFAEFAEREVVRLRNLLDNPNAASGRPAAATLGVQFSWTHQRRALINQLEFPPLHLPDFPANVYVYFVRIPEYGNQVVLKPEKAKPQIDRVEDPVLRILFAHAAGDADRAEKEIEAMLEERTASGRLDLGTGLLAAAFFGDVRSDPDRASTILTSIRNLPMDLDLRRKIDGALIACALAVEDPGDDAPTLVEGKNAALRLRYGRLSASHRGEVVNALTELGLESEATQLAKKGTAPAMRTSRYQSTTSVSAPQDLENRIRKMIGDGKEEQAARLATQTIRAAVKMIASSRGNSQVQIDYQLLNFLRYLQGQLALKKSVEEEFRPSEEGKPDGRKWLDYAIYRELTGDIDGALSAYESGFDALDDKVPAGLRIRATVLRMTRDPEGSVTDLTSLPERNLDQLAGALDNLERISDYGLNRDRDAQFRRRINVARAVTRWLEEMDRERIRKLDLNFLDYRVRNELGSQSLGEVYVPGMYVDLNPDNSWEITGARKRKAEELTRERRLVHDDLCLAMMRSPGLARRTFSFYGGLLIRDDFEKAMADPELKRIAEETLETADFLRSRSPQNFSVHNHYLHGQIMPEWMPEEFLVFRAAWHGDEAAAKDAISRFEKCSTRSDQLRLLKFERILFAGNGKEFEEAAGTFFTMASQANQGHSSSSNVYATGRAVFAPEAVYRIWERRRAELADLDMGEFSLKTAGNRNAGRPASFGLLPVFHYRHLVTEGETEAASDFLKKFTVTFLGEERKWEKFTKEPRKRVPAPGGGYYMQGGNFTDPQHLLFASLMRRLLWSPETVMPVASFLWENELDHGEQLTGNTLLSCLDSPRIGNDAAIAIALISHSPFLGTIETFRTGHSPSHGNAFVQVLSSVKKNPGTREKILSLASEKSTFGAAMVTAFLGEKPKEKVAAVLSRNSDDILAEMTPSTRRDLAAFARNWFGGDFDRLAKLDGAPSRVFDEFRRIEKQSRSREVEEVLSARNLTELEITNDSQLESKLEKLVPPLLKDPEDWPKAASLLQHSIELARKQMNGAGYWSSYNSSGWSMESELLHDVCEDMLPRDSLDAIGFYERTIRADGAGVFAITAGSKGFHSRIRNAYLAAGGDADFENAMTTVVSALSQMWPEGGDESQAALYFKAFSTQLKSPLLLRFIRWTDRQAADPDCPFSGLAREIGMALRLEVARGFRNDTAPLRSKVPDLGAWEEHYSAVLKNEKLSLPWRLAIADAICSGKGELRPGTALHCARILRQTLAADLPLNTWQVVSVGRQFHGLEKTPEWEKLATGLHDAWMHKNRYNHKPGGSGKAFQPHESPIFEMLKIHLKLGDQEKTDRFLAEKYCEGRIDDDARTIVILVEAGQFEHARRFLQNGTSEMDAMDYNATGSQFDPRYTSALRERIPEFLATIEKPDLALFAGLLLNGVRDPKPEDRPKDKPFVFRAGRINPLAQTFLRTDFSGDPALRDRCLQQIAMFPPSSQIIRTELARSYRPEVFKTVLDLKNSTRITEAIRPWAAFAAIRLQEGDTAMVEHFMKTLQRETGISTYYRREALEHFARRLVESLKFRAPKADPAEFAAFHRALGLLATPEPGYMKHDFRVQVYSAHIAAAALSPELDSHVKWVENLGPEIRKDRETALKGNSKARWLILSAILKTKNPAQAASPERRHKVLRVFSRDAGVRVANGGLEEFFPPMLQEKLLSREELLSGAGAELVAAFPRGGLAAAELASHYSEAGRFGEAMEWVEKAFSLGPGPEANPDRYMKLVCARAELLLAEGRETEVAGYLESEVTRTDAEKLSAATRGRLAALQKKAVR